MKKFLILSLISIFILVGSGCGNTSIRKEADIKNSKDRSSITPHSGIFAGYTFAFEFPENLKGWATTLQDISPSSTSYFFSTEGNEVHLYYNDLSYLESSKPLREDIFRQPAAKIVAIKFSLTEEVMNKVRRLPTAHVVASDIVFGHLDEVVCFTEPNKYCNRYIDVDGNRSIIFTDWTDYKLYNGFKFKIPGREVEVNIVR